ncbi:probable Ycf49-like protein [Coccomyxa sp. Obi]|nr:probable Ycf49-like protein [Coccomyxa sp. Obi]
MPHRPPAYRNCNGFEPSQDSIGLRLHPPTCTAFLTAAAALCLPASPALAAIHAEPTNALSLPTWAIHISSTVEWGTAMLLFWRYAEVTGNERWKGLTWGMLPLLGGAMAACTYHFFYNPRELDILVALQAFLTVAGNCTCAWAAYRIYEDAKASSSDA